MVDWNVKQVRKWTVNAFLMKQNNCGGRNRASQLDRSETVVGDYGMTGPGTRLWEGRPGSREGCGCGCSGRQALGETRVSEGPTRPFIDSFGEHVFVELILCARPYFRC